MSLEPKQSQGDGRRVLHTIYGTPSLHHKLKMVCKKLVKNRAGIGKNILHGLSNVQAEFGNEVVDSEINVFWCFAFSCAIFLSLASFTRLLFGFLSDLNSTML